MSRTKSDDSMRGLIALRMDEADIERLRAAADAENVSVSEWVRSRILEALDGQER